MTLVNVVLHHPKDLAASMSKLYFALLDCWAVGQRLEVKLNILKVRVDVLPTPCLSYMFNLFRYLLCLKYVLFAILLYMTNMLPYTSIQSDLFTTPPLVVFPYIYIHWYIHIQSDLFTSPLVVLPYTIVYNQTSS